MPTTIAIESKTVTQSGFTTPFQHFYLVKTVTDETGKVLSEKVIRGGPGPGDDLLVQADIDLARSEDARGSATPAQRHHKVLNLKGRDPDDVWDVMVQHAANINKADLSYSYDIFGFASGGDLNSNTVVASVLYTVGLSLTASLPRGISFNDAPLYNRVGDMLVNDVLTGGDGRDFIFGGMGNDRLNGASGNDRLYGDFGTDVLYGRDGNDLLAGRQGADWMRGGLGSDTYYVEDVADRVTETTIGVEGGVDRIYSTVSLDLRSSRTVGVEELVLHGAGNLSGRGNDLDNVLRGNSFANILSGRSGDDTVSGGSGNDKIYGGSGEDYLRGSNGSDILTGGSGLDIMSGGSGRDTFVFKRTYESGPGAEQRDVIVDFGWADIIDLHHMDANAQASGNQKFTFIGSSAFTGAGQLRFEQDGAGNTIIQANVDANLGADFEVSLRGYTRAINGDDFIL